LLSLRLRGRLSFLDPIRTLCVRPEYGGNEPDSRHSTGFNLTGSGVIQLAIEGTHRPLADRCGIVGCHRHCKHSLEKPSVSQCDRRAFVKAGSVSLRNVQLRRHHASFVVRVENPIGQNDRGLWNVLVGDVLKQV